MKTNGEKREIERKTMPAYLKGVDGRKVTGVTAVMGNVDDGGDRILQGAFAKTIAENSRRFRHLWQHGADGWDYGVTPPIAAITRIQEVGRDALPDVVLTLAPLATGGLEVEREYLETERGNEILAAYKANIELEMSIGFNAVQLKYLREDETARVSLNHWRDIIELKLYDTSDVNWGMNSATVGVKSFERRLALLVERMKTLRDGFDAAAVDESLLVEFRTLCAEFGIDQTKAGQQQNTETESRAEPTPDVRISLTPMLMKLKRAELDMAMYA